MQSNLKNLAFALLALAMISASAPAQAQSKVTIAVGGGACLCYLPTVLAKQLGEYDKAGLAVELVDLKGGSDALKAVSRRQRRRRLRLFRPLRQSRRQEAGTGVVRGL